MDPKHAHKQRARETLLNRPSSDRIGIQALLHKRTCIRTEMTMVSTLPKYGSNMTEQHPIDVSATSCISRKPQSPSRRHPEHQSENNRENRRTVDDVQMRAALISPTNDQPVAGGAPVPKTSKSTQSKTTSAQKKPSTRSYCKHAA